MVCHEDGNAGGDHETVSREPTDAVKSFCLSRFVDDRVAEVFGVPEGYRLVAQMVFGRIVTPAGPKTKLSGDEIVMTAHAKM